MLVVEVDGLIVVLSLLVDVIVEPPATKISLIPRFASLRLPSRKATDVNPDINDGGEVEKERRLGRVDLRVRDRDRDLRLVFGAAEGEVGDTLGVRATMEIPVSHAQADRYDGITGVVGSKDLFK